MKRLGLAFILYAVLLGSAQAQLAGGLVFPGPGTPHSAAGGGCTAATNFLARTSGLSGTETTAYTTMICGLVTDGIITGDLSGATGCGSILDGLYIFATKDTTTANLNLCGTSFGLTQTGTVTFNADVGYTGNGSTGFLDTGFNPNTAAGNFVQNSCSMGIYILQDRTSNSPAAALGNSNGTNFTLIQPLTGGTFVWDLNGGTFPSFANSSTRGAWVISRTSSSSNNAYKNGSSTAVGTSANGTVALANFNLFILAFNSSGSAVDLSTDQKAAAFFGGGLTGAQAAVINNRINTYMSAFSAATYTGTIATTVMTVTAVASGTIRVGQIISGVGITGSPTIISLGTGTGGTGTYNLSSSQTVAVGETITSALNLY